MARSSTTFKKGHKFMGGGKKSWFKRGQKKSIEFEKNRIMKLRKAIVGRKHSEETKKKISESHLKRWIGKRKKYKRAQHPTRENYTKWRMAVFNRDGFVCQGCENVGGKLQAHHIKSWVKYTELRYEVSNGITLCVDCHKLVHKKNYKEI